MFNLYILKVLLTITVAWDFVRDLIIYIRLFVTHIGRRLFYTAKGFAFGRAVKGFIEVSCESRCV